MSNTIVNVLYMILVLVLLVGAIIILLELTDFHFNTANGQEVATKAPEPIQPTPVPTPTPTSPNPNLQYLPQKAYVQSYAPEVGVPSNAIPLQAVPTVVPQPVAATNQTIAGLDIGDIFSTIVAAGSVLAAKFGWDKAKKAENTGQALAETQVKMVAIDQKTLEQQYESMPDKGASITDKPEIKLEEVAKVKEEALKTASKA